ncbi:AbrB/MazE/SpoVT family DNA-binding domain-containing protein [Patescibacteria group bacterium]
MGKMILDNKIVHKLNKSGRYSYSVILPKEIIKEFGWREKQNLELEINARYKTIKIKDWKKKKKKKR